MNLGLVLSGGMAKGDNLAATLNMFDKATKGDTEAMVGMGLMYQVELKNGSKAFYWMQKASNLGNAEGTYWLGKFYINGYGVNEDRNEGVLKIIMAARNGHKAAIQDLKEVGISVEKMRSCGIPV